MYHRSRRIVRWGLLRLQRRHSSPRKGRWQLWKRRWNRSWTHSRRSQSYKHSSHSRGHYIQLFRRKRERSSRFLKSKDHSLWRTYYRFLSRYRFHPHRSYRDHNPLHRIDSFQWPGCRSHLHRLVLVHRRHKDLHKFLRWRQQRNWHRIRCHNRRSHPRKCNQCSLDHCTPQGPELWVRSRIGDYFRLHSSRSPGGTWYRSQWGRKCRCHKSRTLHSHPDTWHMFPQTHTRCSRNL